MAKYVLRFPWGLYFTGDPAEVSKFTQSGEAVHVERGGKKPVVPDSEIPDVKEEKSKEIVAVPKVSGS